MTETFTINKINVEDLVLSNDNIIADSLNEFLYNNNRNMQQQIDFRITNHEDMFINQLNDNPSLVGYIISNRSIQTINNVLLDNNALGTRYAYPFYRNIDNMNELAFNTIEGDRVLRRREDITRDRLTFNEMIYQLNNISDRLGYGTESMAIGYRSKLNSLHLKSREGACVSKPISKDEADIHINIVRKEKSKVNSRLQLFSKHNLDLMQNENIARILKPEELVKVQFSGQVSRFSNTLRNSRHIMQGNKLTLLDGTKLNPDSITNEMRKPHVVQIECALHLDHESMYECTVKVNLIIGSETNSPIIDVICKAMISENNMKKIMSGNMDGIMYEISHWITVIRKSNSEPKLVASRNNWIPFMPNNTLSVITEQGEIANELASRLHSEIDPFTTLPLPKELKVTDRKERKYGMKGYQAITRAGFEFEDAIKLRKSKLSSANNLYLRCVKLFDKLMSKMVSLKISDTFGNQQMLEKTANIVTEIDTFLLMNSKPTISHSDQVWSINEDFNGIKLDNVFNINDLKVRFMLSKLFLISNTKDEPKPVHLRNRNDIEMYKIPLCITTSGILIYTIDYNMTELLGGFKDEPHIHAMVLRAKYFKDKERQFKHPLQPRIVGKTSALPVELNPNHTDNCTHHILTADNKLLNFDEVIIEMSSICCNYMIQEGTSAASFVIWHPDYCIILSSSANSNSKKKIFNCYLIDSPRRTRIVKASHNVSEKIYNYSTDRLIHGDMHLSGTKGYLGALLREFPLSITDIENLMKIM